MLRVVEESVSRAGDGGGGGGASDIAVKDERGSSG